MNEKLRQMRLSAKLTQEQLAEKMNVSRQAVAKWENGDSVPDVIKCSELAKIFDLEIEDIAAAFTDEEDVAYKHPKNKYMFGVSRIVDNRIILPEEAMKIFNLKNGDDLIILGDTMQGMALMPKEGYTEFLSQIMNYPVLGDDENESGN